MSAISVGIGFRRSLARALLACERRVDWLELIPENFVGKDGPFVRALAPCAERWPIGSHSVSLSLGGPDPFDDEHVRALRAFLDQWGIDRHTDHLSFSSAGGYHSHDLLPLPATEEVVRHVAASVREAADRLERPIDLENVSAYVRTPGGTMDEGAFITAVLEEADAGLLLDVNNVYVTARNLDLDPDAFLASLPLERTERIHIAGHADHGHVVIDDHGHPVRGEVLSLLETALRRTGPVPILLEWDTNIPPLDRVLDEADLVRDVAERTSGTVDSHGPSDHAWAAGAAS